MSKLQLQDTSLLKQFEAILQGILSLAAIIYALGFIIVNSYYTSFGVMDYQLIQTRYIAAGLGYLFIHIGIAFMIATIFIVVEIQRKTIWILAFLIVWSLFSAAIYLISKSIINSLAVGVSAGVVIWIGYQIWAIWTKTITQWPDSIPNHFRILFISIGVIIVICISALVWGRSFWPLMSSTLGGGRPNEAVFVFETKNIPAEGLPWIPMQNNRATEQLPILFDNNNEFIILVTIKPNNSAAVRIPKSIILSVIYAPPDSFGKKQKLPPLRPTAEVP